MTRQSKMRVTILILSLCLFSCKGVTLDPYPAKPFYTPDLANQICAEYKLVDKTNITFQWVADHPLAIGGPCDHMRGYEYHDFKDVQNWVRDSIKAAQGAK